MAVSNCVATDSSDQHLEVAGKALTDCEVPQQETAALPRMLSMEYAENRDLGRQIDLGVGCPSAEDMLVEVLFLAFSWLRRAPFLLPL
jgi:hypothetical protein